MIKKFYKGKNVILTGAAGGLGMELAKSLNSNGSSLNLIVSNNSDIRKINFTDKITRCDFANKEDVDNLLKNDMFNDVDILINCAGFWSLDLSIEDTTPERYDEVMNINCRTPFMLSKRSIESMKKKNQGLIINIGSSSSYNGSDMTGVYCVSKHALLGLSRSMTKELKKYNIRVSSFSPSSIQTKMGKSDTTQDFTTFLNPQEVSDFILNSSTFNSEMIISEARMDRISLI
tara:strand:+ start:155 stop:850 length:696 start_codon:yes stop_codon:yes gene_type:complete